MLLISFNRYSAYHFASPIITSAFDIIRERLLLEAKNLITYTSLSIAEVAYQLKFNDPSNFVKFFKSLTTLTPLEYRERLKV